MVVADNVVDDDVVVLLVVTPLETAIQTKYPN